jgi:hypothetical protein
MRAFATLCVSRRMHTKMRTICGRGARAVNHLVAEISNDAGQFLSKSSRSGAIRAIDAAIRVHPKDRIGKVVERQFEAGIFFRKLEDQIRGDFFRHRRCGGRPEWFRAGDAQRITIVRGRMLGLLCRLRGRSRRRASAGKGAHFQIHAEETGPKDRALGRGPDHFRADCGEVNLKAKKSCPQKQYLAPAEIDVCGVQLPSEFRVWDL